MMQIRIERCDGKDLTLFQVARLLHRIGDAMMAQYDNDRPMRGTSHTLKISTGDALSDDPVARVEWKG